MEWSDYLEQMVHTDIQFSTLGKHQSYYLYENDDIAFNRVEPFRDGSFYNLHTVKVRSNVKQTINASVYTHSNKHYHGYC